MTNALASLGVDDLPLVGSAVDHAWPGDVVRGELVAQRPGFEVWSGTSPELGPVSVIVTDEDAAAMRVVTRAREVGAVPGVLQIHDAAERSRWVVAGPIVGYVDDLAALGWKLERKLALLGALADALARLHEMSIVHGEVCPVDVALDPELQPALTWACTEAGARREQAAYAAPEVRAGERATVRSDVYSFGRVIAFVLTGEEPPSSAEAVPKLEFLAREPAGLSRIVRRATVADPERRYADLRELARDLARYGEYESVGLAHAQTLEENLSGLSDPPVSPPPARVASDSHGRRRSRVLAGGLLILAVLCVAALFQPVRVLARAWARHGLDSSSPADRGLDVAKLVSLGDRSFDGARLAGANLAHLQLVSVSFVKTDLEGARFDGADLAGADFSGARLTSSSARGADLTGVVLAGAVGARTVSCDSATVAPPAWHCAAGLLAPDTPAVTQEETQ